MGSVHHITRSKQERIFQVACASATRLGCATSPKSDTVGFQSGNKNQLDFRVPLTWTPVLYSMGTKKPV
eukprot:15366628-Ditylum_brightwellii.AAC.2